MSFCANIIPLQVIKLVIACTLVLLEMEVVQQEVSRQGDPTQGSFYQVLMTDGSWHVAEIIQKRENTESKRQEYYVHYKECKW